MRRVILVGILILALIVALLVFLFKFKGKESFNKDFNIAIVETTEQINESYLTFYNEDLKKIGAQKIELGSMGSSFDLPRVYDKNMYVIPKGIGNAKELSVIMEYNMETGNYKTYDIKQHNINSFSVDDTSIYTVNTLNYNSIISCYNKSSGKVKTISIEKVYIERIDLYDDTIYAFGMLNDNQGIKSYLYLIDTKNFEIADKIDISESGIGQYYSNKIEDNLYFTNQTEMSFRAEKPSKTLSKLNIKDKTISNIQLKEEFPFQILKYKNKLIISHYDLVQIKGNKITIYDPKTNEQKVVTLENELAQIHIKDDKLYSMDRDYLYVYSINDTEFKLINKVDIHTKRESKTFYYLSGFIVK